MKTNSNSLITNWYHEQKTRAVARGWKISRKKLKARARALAREYKRDIEWFR